MLKQYPTLRFILMRAGWYIITFIIAITINFTLPRLGGNDPVDMIMAQVGQGQSPERAQAMREQYLQELGFARVRDGEMVRDTVITTAEVTRDTLIEPADDDEKETVRIVTTKVRGSDTLRDTLSYVRAKTVADAETDGETPQVAKTVTPEIIQDTVITPVMATWSEQFGNYVGMLLRGDLGTSFRGGKVSETIIKAVPWTIALQLPTILFGWIVGNLLGALAAYKRGVFDKVFFPVAIMLSSFPFFVFGILLVYIFGIHLAWFPSMLGYSSGLTPGFTIPFILDAAKHYVLPFFSIFLILAGGQAIGMRSMGIYELGTDYIKYAKWLGLKEGKILAYLFRNAMLPQITGLALSFGTMIGGALITEMIFSYPGLGMAMLDAITKQDYPVIQGVTLIITTTVLIANFSVDILIAFLDPRVKAGLKMGGDK